MIDGLPTYYFIPTVRDGLGTTIGPATDDPRRASVLATLTARVDGIDQVLPQRNVSLFGPGDVLGFDPAIVSRTDPSREVWDCEPNFMPVVEFSEPDFPWRFTPRAAAADGRLTPWLTLIVLAVGEFQEPNSGAPGGPAAPQRPYRWITGVPTSALPDLTYAWRWAHVQVTAGADLQLTELGKSLSDPNGTGHQHVSRLLCARRLAPNMRYSAFVVPTFKASVAAAGGAPLTSADGGTTFAWSNSGGSAATVDLPYYYRWEFGTSLEVDFEVLVRRLEPRALTGLGTRRMDCSRVSIGGNPCPADTADDIGVLHLEGALKSPDVSSVAWKAVPDPVSSTSGARFRDQMAALLNAQASSATGAERLIGPPVYGRRYSGTSTVAAGALDRWQNDVNLDPRLRAAAGFGAFVVQRQQEALMASVWKQLGDIERANAIMRHGQVGLAASVALNKRLSRLSETGLLRVTAPVMARVPMTSAGQQATAPGAAGATRSLQAHLEQSALPSAALDPAFRRVLRRNGGPRKRSRAARSITPDRDVLRRLNAGELTPDDSTARAGGLPSFGMISEETLRAARAERVASAPRPVASGDVRVTGRLVDRETRRPGGRTVEIWTTGARPVLLSTARVDANGDFSVDIPRSQVPHWLPDASPAVEYRVPGRRSITTQLAAEPGAGPSVLLESRDPSARAGTAAMALSEETITPTVLRSAVERPGAPESLHEVAVEIISSALKDWLGRGQVESQPAEPERLDIGRAVRTVRGALDPELTIPARLADRVTLGPGLQQREPAGRVESPVIFPHPMYEPLAAISQDLLLPGVESVPQNTVSVLTVNRRFMEAYMLGLNDALGAEALWRGAPVSLWTTFFRQFWDVRATSAASTADTSDITRLATWGARSALGTHRPRPAEQAVVMIRGELLKRYPNTLVYLLPSIRNGSNAGTPDWGKTPIMPVFSGALEPDLSFLGFDVSVGEMKGSGNAGYFVVLEERIGAPRFGFDLATDPSVAPPTAASWFDVTWEHFQPAGATTFAAFPPNAYLDGRTPTSLASGLAAFGTTSAHVANACLQRPMRVAIHARPLIDPQRACAP